MSTKYFRTFLLLSMAASMACGDVKESAVEPQVEDFEVDPDAQGKIDAAAQSGESAEGSYELDEEQGVLAIDVTKTSFACGLDTGVFQATDVSVGSAEMIWQMEEDTVT